MIHKLLIFINEFYLFYITIFYRSFLNYVKQFKFSYLMEKNILIFLIFLLQKRIVTKRD